MLTLWGCAQVPTEPGFSQFQEALVLRTWESAQKGLISASEPMRSLMRVDYQAARGDFDLAWRSLEQVDLRTLTGEARLYFYFLRAGVEYRLERYRLAQRNMTLLEELPSDTLLGLRVQELQLKLLLREKDAADQVQELLGRLPEHPYRELFQWKLSGLAAHYGPNARWADAALAYTQFIALAKAFGSPRLAVSGHLLKASALGRNEPKVALSHLREATAILEELDGDIEPELAQLWGMLQYSTIANSKQLVALRGRLYRLTSPGRTRWRAAGGYFELPSDLDRFKLLGQALEEAEEAKDHLAAAWLCLAFLERPFSRPEARRVSYIERGAEHLQALPQLYPGRGFFSEASLAAFETLRRAFTGKGDATLPFSQKRTVVEKREELASLAFSHRFEQVSALLDTYFTDLESALPKLRSDRCFSHVTQLAKTGVTNLRYWDVELLSYTGLKEPLPFQELVIQSFSRHEALRRKLLLMIDPKAGRYDRMWHASYLLILDRHLEARRVLSEVELVAKASSDHSLVLRSLGEHLVSLSRTGELTSESLVLQRYLQELERRELNGNYEDTRLVVLGAEALIICDRSSKAVELLDKLFASAGGDETKLRAMAGSSAYINRALAGRIVGEDFETSKSILEQGRRRADAAGSYGAKVHRLHLAALKIEEGQLEGLDEEVESLKKAFDDGTSRLQLGVALALARGAETSQERASVNKQLERYLSSLPASVRQTRSIQRLVSEVQKREQPLGVTTTYVEALAPAQTKAAVQYRWENGRRRFVGTQEFLRYLGDLAQTTEGDSALRFPISLERLRDLQAGLKKGEVILHPLLLQNRLVKLEVRRDSLLVDELFLSGDQLRQELLQWSALVGEPNSKISAIKTATDGLRPLLWDSSLSQEETVWLLLPRPLDGLPWVLLAEPTQSLRWTDGRISGTKARNLTGSVVLAGAQTELKGTQREMAAIEKIYPGALRWQPTTGLEGLARLSLEAEVLHLTGHGYGLSSSSNSGGLLDLGPLQVTLDELFSLQLERHPLVVLATCDGGSGLDADVGRSFNLTTPFRSAGASAVLASIWALDDRYGAQFFPNFYRLLVEDVEPWKALEILRADARKSRKHPFYWAGLFLVESLPALQTP